MKVLIAGCGDLGCRLGVLMAEDGAEVIGLRRRPEELPGLIRGVKCDLASGEGLDNLEGADLVVYALAADRYDDEAYRRAYVDGVRNLLAALEARPPRRWLHVSSTSVYGQKSGEWVDESSAAEPASFGGRRILQGEALLPRQYAVVLRLSGIYGPGRHRMIDRVRGGEARCFEPPIYTNRIHVDDAARALNHLATLEKPAPLYIGVDHEPALDGDVKRWLARRLGAPDPPSGKAVNPLRQRTHKRLSNQLLLDSGFRFLYRDFRAGYGALLAPEPKRSSEAGRR